MGSMPSAYESSSIADSMANEPSASPGALIQPGIGMLWRIWVARVDRLGHAYAFGVPYVIRFINSSAMPIDDLETRSEERRVGKECRVRWSMYNYKKIWKTKYTR